MATSTGKSSVTVDGGKSVDVKDVPADDTKVDGDVTVEEYREPVRENVKEDVDPETPMIVGGRMKDDGTWEHGPMPVADWPAYEKENKL